jgi:hypothetical protein
MKSVYSLITTAITLAIALIPRMDSSALASVERMATVPKEERERFLIGMDQDLKNLGHSLFQKWADATSDLVVFVASRGRIKPD